MNRIKELREAAGWTQGELAERVRPPTTATQISRLELSKRGLNTTWMRRIAEGLQVDPADLISSSKLIATQNDVVLETEHDPAARQAYAALAKRGVRPYKVLTAVVSESGITEGSIVMVDTSSQAIEAARDGDVVLATFRPISKHSAVPECLVLRVWIWPKLLVTNRQGPNHVIGVDDPGVKINIDGVVLKD